MHFIACHQSSHRLADLAKCLSEREVSLTLERLCLYPVLRVEGLLRIIQR